MKRVNFHLTDDQMARLRSLSVATGATVAELVRKAIDAYLKGSPMNATDATVRAGYVLAQDGSILLQLPDANRWGFVIADDDQSWPGGFGVGSWVLLADDDGRISDDDRERLGWLLDEHR